MTMRPPQREQLVALGTCLHPVKLSCFRLPVGHPTVVAIDGLPSSTVRRSKPVNTRAHVATAAGRSAPSHRPPQPPPRLRSPLRDSVWSVHGPLQVAADTRLPRLPGDWPHHAGAWPVGDR